MKKASTLAVIALVCGITLTACSPAGTTGGSDTDANLDTAAVDEAKAAVETATGPTDEWFGPDSAPVPTADKLIVCVEYTAQDITATTWCDGAEEGAAAIGWRYTRISSQSTADSNRTALQQAIALNPDGIVTSLDAASNLGLLEEASNAGIQIVGIHSAAVPGPAPDLFLFTNLTYEPQAQAAMMANLAIADSNGTARLIVVTDTQYAIAKAKADSAQAQIETCSSCEFLEYVSTPAGSTNADMPGLFTSWVQKYGDKPFYVYSVSDAGFFDPGVSALRVGGVEPSGRVGLLGSDGSPAAYKRITDGEYEIGTIPEPARMQGWQAIDEFNRAFNGEDHSGFVQPLHIITKDNVATDITADGIYEPAVDYAAKYTSIWGR